MSLQQSCAAEHAVGTRGAHGDDIGVEHHEGESAVAFQAMGGMDLQEVSLLPGFELPDAGDQRVLRVGQSEVRPPVVELAGGNAEPGDEPLEENLGAFGPEPHELDD